MDALLQRLEVQAAVGGDDDLAVEHAPLRELRLERRHEFGEVARHRPLVAAAELDLVAVAEDDRAEAVPLRLVRRSRRDVGHRLREHRRDGRHHGKLHALIVDSARPDRSARTTLSRCGSAGTARRPPRARRPARGRARTANRRPRRSGLGRVRRAAARATGTARRPEPAAAKLREHRRPALAQHAGQLSRGAARDARAHGRSAVPGHDHLRDVADGVDVGADAVVNDERRRRIARARTAVRRASGRVRSGAAPRAGATSGRPCSRRRPARRRRVRAR